VGSPGFHGWTFSKRRDIIYTAEPGIAGKCLYIRFTLDNIRKLKILKKSS